MPKLRGEDIHLGVATEGTRNSFTSPSEFIPGRSPAGIQVQTEKTLIQETRGSGMNSQASEIVREWAEGDLEFNVRSETIGYILYSLLGSVSSAEKSGDTGVYDHTFSLKENSPLFQTLSLALAKEEQNSNFQDYGYVGSVVSSLELETPVDDVVNATASFTATEETEENDFSPAYQDADRLFNHTDVKIELAADVGSLGGDGEGLKEFSLTIENGAERNDLIGSDHPEEILAKITEVTGSLSADFENEDYHDIYTGGTYKAMRITMTRSDVTLGSSSNPTLELTMPKVSFEGLDNDRSIDDIAMEDVDFTAHYDSGEGYGIEAVLTNEVTSY